MGIIAKKSDKVNESIDNATIENIKWSDLAFINEMNERLESFNDNKSKTYSWTEVQEEAFRTLKNRKLCGNSLLIV